MRTCTRRTAPRSSEPSTSESRQHWTWDLRSTGSFALFARRTNEGRRRIARISKRVLRHLAVPAMNEQPGLIDFHIRAQPIHRQAPDQVIRLRCRHIQKHPVGGRSQEKASQILALRRQQRRIDQPLRRPAHIIGDEVLQEGHMVASADFEHAAVFFGLWHGGAPFYSRRRKPFDRRRQEAPCPRRSPS